MSRTTLALASIALAALTACTHRHHGTPGTPSTASPGGSVTRALWVANGTTVVEFLPSQLASGGNQQPHLIDASTSFGSTQGVAFDASGNLWVVDGGTLATQGSARPALYEFTANQLASLASTQNPVPFRTIEYTGFSFPQQAVFDAGGNLWVTDNGRNAVYEYTPSQLATGGFNLAPNVKISANPAFAGALGIAFSPAGNLWVSNNASSTIDEFDASSLPTAFGSVVTLTPHVILQSTNQSISGPWGLAFDAAGDLWSSNANSPNTVVKFGANVLGSSGKPAPFVIASVSDGGNPTLVAPNGIAFDNLGDLAAIGGAAPYGIPFYAASQFGSGGGIVPHTFLVGSNTTLVAPAGAVFGPIVN